MGWWRDRVEPVELTVDAEGLAQVVRDLCRGGLYTALKGIHINVRPSIAEIARESFMALPPRWYLTEALMISTLPIMAFFLVGVAFWYAPLTVWWLLFCWFIASVGTAGILCAACTWRDYLARRRMEVDSEGETTLR